MNLESLTPAKILSIPVTEPERLFSAPDTAKDEHYVLAKTWYPDRNPDPAASRVMAHINALWDAAERKIISGTWSAPDTLLITSRGGARYKLAYRALHSFELGHVAIMEHHVAFIIDRKHEDLYLNGIHCIGFVTYPDKKMRDEHEKFVPYIEHAVDTEGQYVVVLRKTPETVLLRDLIAHCGSQLDPKHVAWIISSLLNIACFYQITDFVHNGLSADTILISPQHHTAFPIGGWWYGAKAKSPIKWLPPSSHMLAPSKLIAAKRAEPLLDLECIRGIGRACLGDISGGGLLARKDIPAPLASFLMLPSSGSALADYIMWCKKVLPDSFGPRRFTEMPVTFSGVYPRKEIA